MATKQEYQAWVKQWEEWIKAVKKIVKKLPEEGDISTASSGIETPVKPPPNP